MKILVVADPHIPVPPRLYGGAERVVHLLCAGLREQGHTVRLLAGPGSQDYGGGLWVHRAPDASFLSRAVRKAWFQLLSRWAARGALDVVVNFGRLDYLVALLRRTRLPLICWFENPVAQSELDWVLARRRRALRFVGVSHSQVEGLRADGRMQVIHNAVDTDQLDFQERPATPPYVAFLGRLTRNKGVHLAIEAARRAGVALKIAGNVSKGEEGAEEYFEREVRPHLGEGCEWIGPVNDEQKRALLQGATATLFPTQWKEPCAVVVPESLACGTPVIAWRIASTPEVVRAGVSGYLCDSVEDMVAAIARVRAGALRREDCRREAQERFSQDALVGRFLDLLGGQLPADSLR